MARLYTGISRAICAVVGTRLGSNTNLRTGLICPTTTVLLRDSTERALLSGPQSPNFRCQRRSTKPTKHMEQAVFYRLHNSTTRMLETAISDARRKLRSLHLDELAFAFCFACHPMGTTVEKTNWATALCTRFWLASTLSVL